MTSSTRRAFPWLVSIGAHLAALFIVAVLLASGPAVALLPPVEITFAGAPGPGRGAPGSAGSLLRGMPRQAPIGVPASAVPETPASHAPSAPVALAGTRIVPDKPFPEPTAGDVLADTASVSPALASSTAGGSPSGTMVGLEGIQRKLIRKRDPEFPTVLSAIGQEIEGEARISVAPSGIVTRVEITRSSGYIEIDASVEAALRDYLFSRVDGRIDTVGTVHFRFRLEKQD
jgi:outer membrane biosynthesis protein TonB